MRASFFRFFFFFALHLCLGCTVLYHPRPQRLDVTLGANNNLHPVRPDLAPAEATRQCEIPNLPIPGVSETPREQSTPYRRMLHTHFALFMSTQLVTASAMAPQICAWKIHMEAYQ